MDCMMELIGWWNKLVKTIDEIIKILLKLT